MFSDISGLTLFTLSYVISFTSSTFSIGIVSLSSSSSGLASGVFSSSERIFGVIELSTLSSMISDSTGLGVSVVSGSLGMTCSFTDSALSSGVFAMVT